MVEVKVKDIEIATKKYIERARAGAPLYAEMVKVPKRDPTAAAISMKETLKAKMRADETWDKWETKLAAVGFEGWLDAVLSKGVPRFVPGIEHGSKYWRQFYSQFKPHLEAGLAKVYALPRVTLEDSIARAAEMIRHNAKFRFVKKYIKE